MEAFDRGFFYGSVHSLNLTISPRMFDLGESMFNAMLSADTVKNVIASVPIARAVRELDAVVNA